MLGTRINYKDGSTDYFINDRANQPQLWNQSPFYYVSLDSIDGLYGADISYESHPIPNAIGDASGDVFRRGKTVTLSGTIFGKAFGRLDAGADWLQKVFTNTARRHLIWTRYSDGISVYLIGRVSQDLAITENLSGYAPKYQWTVGIRCDDPRSRKVSDDSVYPTWQA